jgi:hypothetical protein
MKQRKIPAIARGVQSRRRLRNVLADDRGIADLLVTETKLVMGKADGFRIVRELCLAQGAAEESDCARLIALGERDAAVDAPKRGKKRWRQIVALGWTAQSRHGLDHVVGKQPRLGKRATQADLILVFEAGGLERLRQHGDCVGMLTAF